MKKLFIATCILFFSSLTLAASDIGDRQITSFGIQSGGSSSIGYITVTPSQSTNCLYGVIYIYNANESGGKLLVAAALTAYTSGKPIKRIDYDVKVDGTCSITLINL